MKEKIFLTETGGITSTSAEHLASIANEKMQSALAQLNEITFLNKEIELINGDKKLLRKGVTGVEHIQGLIEHVARMHTFMAWIREAIKTKEELLSKVSSMRAEEFAKISGEEYPTLDEEEHTTSVEDLKEEFDIKDMFRYLSLEAHSASYGKFIHPDNSISIARRDLLKKINCPTEVYGDGRDLTIRTYTPSVNPDEVEKVFLALQDARRAYNKQLNAIKASLKEDANRINEKKRLDYQKKSEEYLAKKKIFINKFTDYIEKERERIAKLKIIIPDSLRVTYDYLNE